MLFHIDIQLAINLLYQGLFAEIVLGQKFRASCLHWRELFGKQNTKQSYLLFLAQLLIIIRLLNSYYVLELIERIIFNLFTKNIVFAGALIFEEASIYLLGNFRGILIPFLFSLRNHIFCL
jgi:hypothetical protein